MADRWIAIGNSLAELTAPKPNVSIDTSIKPVGNTSSFKVTTGYQNSFTTPDINSTDMYLSFNYRISALPGTETIPLYFRTIGSPLSQYFRLYLKANGALRIQHQVGSTTTFPYEGGAGEIDAATWHLIEIALKGSDQEFILKVDGVELGADAWGGGGTIDYVEQVYFGYFVSALQNYANIYWNDSGFHVFQYPTPENPGVLTAVKK